VSNTENQTIVRLRTEVGDSVLLGLPDFGSLCRWTGRKDQFRPGCMLRHRCERLTILIVFLSSKKKSVKNEALIVTLKVRLMIWLDINFERAVRHSLGPQSVSPRAREEKMNNEEKARNAQARTGSATTPK